MVSMLETLDAKFQVSYSITGYFVLQINPQQQTTRNRLAPVRFQSRQGNLLIFMADIFSSKAVAAKEPGPYPA
jgi:hypothetical protein